MEEGFESADHIVSGEVHVGGQEHFYLETQASIVVPKEGGEMEIFTSTQNAHMTQIAVAMVTGVPANRIAVRVKRIGRGCVVCGVVWCGVLCCGCCGQSFPPLCVPAQEEGLEERRHALFPPLWQLHLQQRSEPLRK